ncbi:zona pellucida sperm-binding protein 3d.2 isoform X1 [Fundulus heteroclitus]|uniref:zona pellucida sperm-binding protein 3d.2 isoform X1 n=1 Tax=Fundulus heteroclitus TaxID=8078 RepID=UPI00165B066F|nr:zona pellucida sperm-binding protein 3d.2 isoform X1 [Fundulus heteroclitus]
MVLLLLLLLLSSAHQACQAVQSPNRTGLLLPRGQTATLLQQRYLSLPMYLDSDLPLLRRDFFSPARGTGQEALPQPVRELLLPVWPHASGPPSVSGAAVRTSCERNKMQLQVERSVLGSGDAGSHLKLGTCSVSRSTEDHVYFEYDLRMCGTKRTMINNQIVYFNMLRYDPPKPRGPIRRAAPFSMPVACYFNRFVYSYKVGYTPKVQMQKVLKKMKNSAEFVLTPRNAQWNQLSRSDHFVLGEPMFFAAEAEALSRDERLYVHTCYVTPEESHTSTPQFPVVTNFGCMVESKNGRSRFIPHKNNAVRFSLDAFVFKGMTGQQLYMHCSMVVGSSAPTPTAKSCNYDTKVRRWVELFGSESVCDCCESSCSSDQSTETEVISSTSWTINPEVKSASLNQKRKTAGSSRDLTESPAGRTEEKLWPAGVVGVQMGGGAEGRRGKDGEEKLSALQAMFEDIFDFD